MGRGGGWGRGGAGGGRRLHHRRDKGGKKAEERDTGICHPFLLLASLLIVLSSSYLMSFSYFALSSYYSIYCLILYSSNVVFNCHTKSHTPYVFIFYIFYRTVTNSFPAKAFPLLHISGKYLTPQYKEI